MVFSVPVLFGEHAPESLPADKMDVKVGNFLPAVQAAVADKPVAVCLDAEMMGDIADGANEIMRFFGTGARGEIAEVAVGALGDHQCVRCGLRCDVVKGEAVFCFVDFLAGDFAAQDPCEDIAAVIGGIDGGGGHAGRLRVSVGFNSSRL